MRTLPMQLLIAALLFFLHTILCVGISLLFHVKRETEYEKFDATIEQSDSAIRIPFIQSITILAPHPIVIVYFLSGGTGIILGLLIEFFRLLNQ
jgi:hypothetical protein